jgi:hypothetical protein
LIAGQWERGRYSGKILLFFADHVCLALTVLSIASGMSAARMGLLDRNNARDFWVLKLRSSHQMFFLNRVTSATNPTSKLFLLSSSGFHLMSGPRGGLFSTI